jgi:DNA-binding transcriptional LysR family regulator
MDEQRFGAQATGRRNAPGRSQAARRDTASIASFPAPDLPHLDRAVDPFRLRLVLELGRRGTISEAADACSIGQPTASMHLQRLEAAIGHQLYERAGRGTRLTDAGRMVARHAAVVLSAMESLQQELAALRTGAAGTLRVSALDGLGNYVLPEVLAGFTAEHRHAHVRLRVARSGDVLQDVARGDADLGVAGQFRRPDGVVTEQLTTDELVGIGPRGFPARPSLAELERAVLIVSTPESSTRAHTERLLNQVRWRPARKLELDSVEAVKRAVACGAGLAIVSIEALSLELAAGELTCFGVPGGRPVFRSIELVRREHREPPPLERAFEQALREHLERRVPRASRLASAPEI